ncbi:Lin1244/Lin1753 domain-containing protein [Lentilactobacillus kosonis]|uniref:DnaD domain protein n=1 Tax=Lentilactobacillus kosonis TaxID=2810561 RepID=A0A401FPG4_9LACO|nr:Lin1244/Lin1753 domain-containing protein [Lentilactobacillus kosonis]GAY74243.1 DnaD domain protein [Lentilactobacillus kosonis]
MKWDKLSKMQLANRVNSTPEAVDKLVHRLVEYETFDEELFKTENVLTSVRIQNTYIEATKRRKNAHHDEFWLLDDEPMQNQVQPDQSEEPVKKDSTDNLDDSKAEKAKLLPSDEAEQRMNDEFIQGFWQNYPKRQKYQEALAEYTKAREFGATEKEIIDGVKNYSKYLKAKGKGDGYTALPTTWLAGKRWQDDYDLTPETAGAKQRSPVSYESFDDSVIPF